MYEVSGKTMVLDNNFWEQYIHPDNVSMVRKIAKSRKTISTTLNYRLCCPGGKVKHIEETIRSKIEGGYQYRMRVQKEI